MTNEEKAKEIARKITKAWGLSPLYNKVCYAAAMEMAQWRDKQVAVNNRKFEKLRKNLEHEIRKGNI